MNFTIKNICTRIPYLCSITKSCINPIPYKHKHAITSYLLPTLSNEVESKKKNKTKPSSTIYLPLCMLPFKIISVFYIFTEFWFIFTMNFPHIQKYNFANGKSYAMVPCIIKESIRFFNKIILYSSWFYFICLPLHSRWFPQFRLNVIRVKYNFNLDKMSITLFGYFNVHW